MSCEVRTTNEPVGKIRNTVEFKAETLTLEKTSTTFASATHRVQPKAEIVEASLGVHVSVAGGVHHAPRRGKALGCTTIQIFTSNALQWKAKPLAPAAIEAFRVAQQQTKIWPVVAHASYLLNLASPDGTLYGRSLEALRGELQRAKALGLPYVVMHPGAHMGSGEREGLARIAQGLNRVQDQDGTGKVMVLLETTAGQGTQLGYQFEHFARIMDQLNEHRRVGVCLDTNHVFSAGYDISTTEGYASTFEELDRLIGLDRLHIVHLNDSRHACGTRKDSHAHIGRGHLGLEAFRRLLSDYRLASLPFILETPKGKNPEGQDWDAVNLSVLRHLHET